jgi:hypothetical protein
MLCAVHRIHSDRAVPNLPWAEQHFQYQAVVVLAHVVTLCTKADKGAGGVGNPAPTQAEAFAAQDGGCQSAIASTTAFRNRAW